MFQLNSLCLICNVPYYLFLLTKALIKINNNNNNGCSEVSHVAYLNKPYLPRLGSITANNSLKTEYEITSKRQLFTEYMDNVSEKLINNISFYKSFNRLEWIILWCDFLT